MTQSNDDELTKEQFNFMNAAGELFMFEQQNKFKERFDDLDSSYVFVVGCQSRIGYEAGFKAGVLSERKRKDEG